MPDTIPNYWVWKTPITVHKEVLVFKPYYGPNQTRMFGLGEKQHLWELGNDDSPNNEFTTIKTFWDSHFPGVDFYLYDPQIDESRLYQIDSDMSVQYNHADSYSWSFRIRESWPYTALSGQPPPP